MSYVNSAQYHQLNTQMLDGDLKIGETAEKVDKSYQRDTASTCKRVFLGILTLGVYSIVHAVKDKNHSSAMKNLSRGTENLYKGLNRLMKDTGNNPSVKITMCNESVTLSRDAEQRCWATFADKSKVEIKNPLEVLHNIERDVFSHSRHFEKSLVVDTILKTYEDRIDQGSEELQEGEWEEYNQGLNRLHDAGRRVRQDFGDNNANFSNLANLARQSSNLQPIYARKTQRYDELLSLLFTKRLGLDPSEAAYIDRDLGKQLARNVMDGTISTAADARIFINRNASATHFTTVEGARIYAQFQQAQENERTHEVRDNQIGTSSISFVNGYYQPKPNPVLPQGQVKLVHDFVANLISDSNVNLQDRDRDHSKNFDGQRLRTLIYNNRAVVALLMENRDAVRKDPATPSLLATIDPKIREALEEQLDKINAEYRKALESRQKSVNLLQKIVDDPEQNGDAYKKELDDARQRLNYYEGVEGRENYLREALRSQETDEKKLRGRLGTNDISTATDEELTTLNSHDAFKEVVKKSDVDEKDADNIFMLEENRERINLGLNFFGEAEKKINEAVKQGCRDLQNTVNQLLAGVFPPAPDQSKTTLDGVRNSTLKQIIGAPEQDAQLQLLRRALEIYFEKMPEMDQRAMLAAGVRFCADDGNASQGAKLGAILKGAGPVMQKMLQGLDPLMFAGNPDFQLAIADMKDKLAPIEQNVIHAQLFDIVKNSGGAIRGISVDKALGAASVAQALKCTISYADGTTRNCVIKVLRPDATMKAQREESVFLEAAGKVGNGMDVTFKGQFAQIMEEMDLRTEAKNVVIGNQVYDYNKSAYNRQTVNETYGSFSNDHSMRLVDGIPPSSGVMALEEVKGETLEDYIKDIGDESRRIARQTAEDIGKRGDADAAMLSKTGADSLTRLYEDAKSKYEALVNLSYMWTNEGLFAEGFYHGDIHKGNIMTSVSWKMTDEEIANDPGKGITVIDFGNASKLDGEQKSSVVKVVAGTAAGETEIFATGFKALLSADSRAKFEAAGKELQDKLAAIFAKGTLNDTASRLSAALKLMQRDYQIEIPPAIHNFQESQRRLQAAMDDTLSVMNAIAAEREKLIAPYLDRLGDEEQEDMKTAIRQAKEYRPVSIMKSITDVVKQNLLSAMKSIGGVNKAKRCYDKIKNDLEQELTNAQNAGRNGNQGPQVLEV